MLSLYNDQISLLVVLAVNTGLLYNDHLPITTAETSSPKWSLYTDLTVVATDFTTPQRPSEGPLPWEDSK